MAGPARRRQREPYPYPSLHLGPPPQRVILQQPEEASSKHASPKSNTRRPPVTRKATHDRDKWYSMTPAASSPQKPSQCAGILIATSLYAHVVSQPCFHRKLHHQFRARSKDMKSSSSTPFAPVPDIAPFASGLQSPRHPQPSASCIGPPANELLRVQRIPASVSGIRASRGASAVGKAVVRFGMVSRGECLRLRGEPVRHPGFLCERGVCVICRAAGASGHVTFAWAVG